MFFLDGKNLTEEHILLTANWRHAHLLVLLIVFLLFFGLLFFFALNLGSLEHEEFHAVRGANQFQLLRLETLLFHLELHLGNKLALLVENEESAGIFGYDVRFVNERAEIVVVDAELGQQIHEGKVGEGLHHNRIALKILVLILVTPKKSFQRERIGLFFYLLIIVVIIVIAGHVKRKLLQGVNHATIFGFHRPRHMNMILKHDLFRLPGEIVFADRVKQEEHSVVPVQDLITDRILVKVRVKDATLILFGQLKRRRLGKNECFGVLLKHANLFGLIHGVKGVLAFGVEEKVDLIGAHLVDALHERVCAHFGKRVYAVHLRQPTCRLHHKVERSMFVHDHILAHHFSELAQLHGLPHLVLLKVVLLQHFDFLFVLGQRESDWELAR